jgi:hypothetical protein
VPFAIETIEDSKSGAAEAGVVVGMLLTETTLAPTPPAITNRTTAKLLKLIFI